MLTKNPSPNSQLDMFRPKLTRILSLEHPLVLLADKIDWKGIYTDLLPYYSHTGRGSIPSRKIVGLLMLKRMFNQSDEACVDTWIENPYWQYFTGEEYFQTEKPFDPSEFVHFRKRLGEAGMENILSYTVKLHRGASTEKEVLIDTTAQPKNITYPTDTKLANKVIKKCRAIAKSENIQLRRSYKKEMKRLIKEQYNAKHPRRRKKAIKARKRIKTIAKTLVRELRRKLPEDLHSEALDLFDRVLNQQRNDKNKIYSLHEVDVACIAKGKVHKKYEYGNKVSVVKGSKTGVITSMKSYQGNPNDRKTVQESLEQSERVRQMAGGKKAELAIADRGYKGAKPVNGTVILTPDSSHGKSKYEKEKARKRFRNRAGIEPVIGHLKHDHRMLVNYLKGIPGDINNALLAAIGFNLKKMLNIIRKNPGKFIQDLIILFFNAFYRKTGKLSF
jgi:IS5 family transposase